MKNKSYAAIALVVIVAIAAFWYWSPVLALRQMQTAAQNGDAETFNAHVDYPKLRESLKGQFSAMVAQKMGAQQDQGNPFAALGNLIGLGLVNQMVDVMVRPEMVMAAMKNGQLAKTIPAPPQPSVSTPAPREVAPPPDVVPANSERQRWILDRSGANTVTAYAVDPAKPDEPNAGRLALVFERSGILDWKLTDIRMPRAVFEK